ncbi:MAG: hypothetical protein AB1489_38275 [Acidobacteriota bacterium]
MINQHTITIEAHDGNIISTNTYTLSQHKELFAKLLKGMVSAEELKAGFHQLVSSDKEVKAELRKYTVKELQRMASLGARGLAKEKLIESVYDNLLTHFALERPVSWQPFSEKYLTALTRVVLSVSDEDICKYAQERNQRRAEFQKALTNPETAEEFRTFISYRGESKLTPEQRIKWDEVQAAENFQIKDRELEHRAVVAKVELGNTQMEIVEHFHTKRGHLVYIVKLGNRVDNETFKELAEKARKFSGNYAKSWQGSPAGFMFNKRGDAELFIDLRKGDVSRLQAIQTHKQESREHAADRLQGLAERLEERANASLNQDRLANTIRRAQFAASAEAKAQHDLAIGKTIGNIVAGIKKGSIQYLADVKAKTHIETLEAVLYRAKYQRSNAINEPYDQYKDRSCCVEDVEYAEYPFPTVYTTTLKSVMDLVKSVPGTKLLLRRLEQLFSFDTKNHELVTFQTDSDIEDLKTLISMAESYGHKNAYQVKALKSDRSHYDRLKAMGLDSLPMLRAALREYLQLKIQQAKCDQVKVLERDLIGRKINGYFPTPIVIAEEMVKLANIKPGMTVVEPSAGKGNIADVIRVEAPAADLYVIEPVTILRDILIAKGYNLVGYDFLEHFDEYDRIVMNPPFEDGKDIEHLRHAYNLLKSGGRLVGIMSEGPFFRSDKQAKEFREWFDSVSGESERLPDGSFKDSERPTGVATRLVILDKRAA